MASEVEQLDILSAKCNDLKAEIAKVIVGQEEVINQLLVTIFSRGHCLLVAQKCLANRGNLLNFLISQKIYFILY